MISRYKNNNVVIKGNERDIEYRGLSTDEKPTENITNGAIFIEINTGKIYMFDLESTEWKEI